MTLKQESTRIEYTTPKIIMMIILKWLKLTSPSQDPVRRHSLLTANF